MNNMEWIQSVSLENLAAFLEQYGCPNTEQCMDCLHVGGEGYAVTCVNCWESWLRKEYEG